MSRVAVLVGSDGRGTNMKSLVLSNLGVSLVVSPKENHATVWARDSGVLVEILPKSTEYTSELLELLSKHQIDVICLAGYLYLLPPEVVRVYRNRILNIHPSLLPKFGGKGMYGINVHQVVINSGEKESGCTVHIVNEHYDEGSILLQLVCDVTPDDTPQTLSEKVLELEKQAYPQALIKLLSDLKQEF